MYRYKDTLFACVHIHTHIYVYMRGLQMYIHVHILVYISSRVIRMDIKIETVASFTDLLEADVFQKKRKGRFTGNLGPTSQIFPVS